MASAPATGPLAAWADTWSARGTRKASGGHRRGGGGGRSEQHEDRALARERVGPGGQGLAELQVVGQEVGVLEAGEHVGGPLAVLLGQGGGGGQPRGQLLDQLAAEHLGGAGVDGQQLGHGRPVGVGAEGEALVGEGELAVDPGPGVLQDLADAVAQAAVDLVGVDQHHRAALEPVLDQLGHDGGPEGLEAGLLLLEGDVLRAVALAPLADPSLVARRTETVPSWSTVLPTTMPRARARNTATSDTMW